MCRAPRSQITTHYRHIATATEYLNQPHYVSRKVAICLRLSLWVFSPQLEPYYLTGTTGRPIYSTDAEPQNPQLSTDGAAAARYHANGIRGVLQRDSRWCPTVTKQRGMGAVYSDQLCSTHMRPGWINEWTKENVGESHTIVGKPYNQACTPPQGCLEWQKNNL